MEQEAAEKEAWCSDQEERLARRERSVRLNLLQALSIHTTCLILDDSESELQSCTPDLNAPVGKFWEVKRNAGLK